MSAHVEDKKVGVTRLREEFRKKNKSFVVTRDFVVPVFAKVVQLLPSFQCHLQFLVARHRWLEPHFDGGLFMLLSFGSSFCCWKNFLWNSPAKPPDRGLFNSSSMIIGKFDDECVRSASSSLATFSKFSIGSSVSMKTPMDFTVV